MYDLGITLLTFLIKLRIFLHIYLECNFFALPNGVKNTILLISIKPNFMTLLDYTKSTYVFIFLIQIFSLTK